MGNTQSDTSIPVFCEQRTIHCPLNSRNSPRPVFPTIITLSLKFIEVQVSSRLLGTLHLCMKYLSPLRQKKSRETRRLVQIQKSPQISFFFSILTTNNVTESLCTFVPAQKPSGGILKVICNPMHKWFSNGCFFLFFQHVKTKYPYLVAILLIINNPWCFALYGVIVLHLCTCTSTTPALKSQPTKSIKATTYGQVHTAAGTGQNFRVRGHLPHSESV